MKKVISLEQAINSTYDQKEKEILKNLISKFLKKYDNSINNKEQKLLNLAKELNLDSQIIKTLEKNLNSKENVEIRSGKWVLASLKRFIDSMK